MHLSAVHPRCAAALVGDVAYGLVPVQRDRPTARNARCSIAREFLDRIGDRVRAVVGVGPVVSDAAKLAPARASADRALRVLRTGQRAQRVARLDDVHVESLVLELRDLVVSRGDELTGPIARLLAYDEQHHTNLVETLRAWLDAFGDVARGLGRGVRAPEHVPLPAAPAGRGRRPRSRRSGRPVRRDAPAQGHLGPALSGLVARHQPGRRACPRRT